MAMNSRDSQAIWMPAAIVVISFAIGASAEPIWAVEPCVQASDSLLSSRTKMRVFRVERDDEYMPLGEMLSFNAWDESNMRKSDYFLKHKVGIFANAQGNTDPKAIDERFSVKQFLDLNYYDLKTDCNVDGSKERHKFCRQIKTGKGSSDRLIENLFNYCSTMADKVDKCCRQNTAHEISLSSEFKLLSQIELKASQLKAKLWYEQKWLTLDEAIKQYLKNKGSLYLRRVRNSCGRLREKLKFILADEKHELDQFFDKELDLCKKIDSI